MNCVTYGVEHAQTIILIHGGGLSWWNFRQEAEILKNGYRVVLPLLDGHDGSDRPFTSIEDNAEEIISMIDRDFGGSVLLIGGLSLGAQVVLEILSRRKNICRHALVESPSVIPSAVTKALTGPMVGCSYALIKNRAFSKLQFRSLHIQKDLFEDYYRDTCRISKADMKAFLKASVSYRLKEEIKECRADVHVFAGERETGVVLQSARLIKETIPGCSLRILPHLYHGEFSLNHPGDYAYISLAIVRRCRV